MKFLSLIIFAIINCSVFQLKEHKNLEEWYFGRPGLKNTFGIVNEKECIKDQSEILIRITDDRHWLYLHFRTPEVFWNPQGGIYFPKFRRDCIDYEAGLGWISYLEGYDFQKGKRGSPYKKGNFDVVQGGFQGFIDTIIPYRTYTAKDYDTEQKIAATIFSPYLATFGNGLHFYISFPVYVSHDIAKTAMIPFAGIYYLNKDD